LELQKEIDGINAKETDLLNFCCNATGSYVIINSLWLCIFSISYLRRLSPALKFFERRRTKMRKDYIAETI